MTARIRCLRGPTKLSKKLQPLFIQLCADAKRLLGNRMYQVELVVAKHQTMAGELLAKKAVMATIAMAGIAHYGMGDMGHMTTKLVLTAGFRP